MSDKCETFVARWDHAMCSTCGAAHAPTPTPAPGLDLDAVERADIINAAADMLDASCAGFADGMGHDNIRDHVAAIRAMATRLRGCAKPDGAMRFVAPVYVGELAAKIKDQATKVRSLRAKLAEAKRLGREACGIAASAVQVIDDEGIDDDNESPRVKRDLGRIAAALEAL